MAATPYLVRMADDEIARVVMNGMDAVVVCAGSAADAIAMAKGQFDGDNNAAWTNATATAIVAGTDLSGYELRIRLTSPLGVDAADITIGSADTSAVKATGTLTTSTQPSDTNTITIGSKVYTLQSSLTNVDGHVKIAASEALTLVNLLHAINATGGTPGTDYAAAMTANPSAEATASAAHTLSIRALVAGTAGNAIATTDTLTAGGDGFAAATLLGGEDAATFDTIGNAAAAALVALGLTSAYAPSTQTLTVAAGGDAKGDYSLMATFRNTAWADPITIPSFLGAITANGSSGDAVTVVLGADADALPGTVLTLSDTIS